MISYIDFESTGSSSRLYVELRIQIMNVLLDVLGNHCRFVQFGPEVKCCCGALNCQGYLGTKRKVDIVKPDLYWGTKRKRTSTSRLAVVTV